MLTFVCQRTIFHTSFFLVSELFIALYMSHFSFSTNVCLSFLEFLGTTNPVIYFWHLYCSKFLPHIFSQHKDNIQTRKREKRARKTITNARYYLMTAVKMLITNVSKKEEPSVRQFCICMLCLKRLCGWFLSSSSCATTLKKR